MLNLFFLELLWLARVIVLRIGCLSFLFGLEMLDILSLLPCRLKLFSLTLSLDQHIRSVTRFPRCFLDTWITPIRF